MRENLFRAKKYEKSVFDETDWVYGSLIDSGNHEQVFIYPWLNGASTMSCRRLVYARMETVNPETVGQYTGLTDKNGKMIFEGDILKAIAGNPVGEPIVANVVPNLNDYELMWDIEHSYELEIIGNIHDNPELIPH